MTRLRIPAHRAGSATLAGAYPFLTPPPLALGVPVGVDAVSGQRFCFDPFALYRAGVLSNPNLLLAGVIGAGKSALAKTLAIRAIAAGARVYVPGDPKGEWGPVAAAVGGQSLTLAPGAGIGINPLTAGGDDPPRLVHARRLGLLVALAAALLHRGLTPGEHAALDDALTATETTSRTPPLSTVTTHLTKSAAGSRNGGRGVEVGLALGRLVRGPLTGLFDREDPTGLERDAPMLVLDLSALAGDEDLLACATTATGAWLDAATATVTGPRWIIYDEAWRLMRAPALLAGMQEQWKLARARAVANLLILHRLSDLAAVADTGSRDRALADGLLADTSVRIVYRQEADQVPAARAAYGLTGTEAELLPRLARGVGLWKLPTASYLVRHCLHPDEYALIDSDAAINLAAQAGSRAEQGPVVA